MSRHKTGYVISYHGILCHDMSYVTSIAASLLRSTRIVAHYQFSIILQIVRGEKVLVFVDRSVTINPFQ